MTNPTRAMRVLLGSLAVLSVAATVLAQSTPPPRPAAGGPQKPGNGVPVPVSTAPVGYVIGVDDVLTISVWRDKDLAAEVVVLPDGRITFPLINEIQAAGLTVEQLRASVGAALSAKYVQDPIVSVVVKPKSRKVYITGAINKPGEYELTGQMTIVQLITLAGGLQEFADKKNITIVRVSERRPDGAPVSFVINYREIQERKNLAKNLILLKPGDQVMVK